ncbi:hypothetical protein CBF58_05855 [Lactobacillus taiwanensis]|uniref:Uncharacterized protein n=1 Tax=Lactobacillus taiwanensis TaxID=508451 RepID=A0A256LID1_9LACO|nr:hypothetical protein [Lactobacillus taiwanensis]OYR88297.1 hypothetical protein CBF53_03215 [Lactobacillus taiwanensis]OYR92347.1 hypothetical protein CBF70_04825 [Lactobacillus taiwanensis]OYR95738.1 hypothetical protein CBF58_05855 [Lactobacillus taiwanensis]QTQ39584.1 hypothetical protein H1A07_06915 [Lactobacillus taiwanensis]
MYLDDFLILIAHLHPNFQLFYQPRKSDSLYPISKIKIESKQCVFLIGKKPKTIAQIRNLLGKLKYNHLPIYVYIEELDKKDIIFSNRINLKKGHVYIR